ncbi:MAG TPA: hypothetical protein VFL13_10365 [Candidatus Baltobacteraceae bacterium]|nr:hypothetical protein [Candidatus Baltobacteraceae bacterium]
MSMQAVIYAIEAALVLIGLWFAYVLFTAIRQYGKWPETTPVEYAIGFVTDLLDTLGIGSFAITTAAYKLWKRVPDERIPGTLNVGHALPTVVEALVFIAVVGVAPWTLVLLILAAVLGSWLGAGIVANWPRRYVQIGMGVALVAAAILFAMKNLGVGPAGGTALGLTGTLLIVGIVGNFILGALMTLGIGLYAPAMIMVSLLGMSPLAAFPIMMGSCAFLMPVASKRFIKFNAYELRAALGLTIAGIPGVLIAAYLVKSLPLVWVRWLVVLVVIYTAIMMLRSAYVERSQRAVGAGAIATE